MKPLSDAMKGTLNRSGIAKQVGAAITIEKAQQALDEVFKEESSHARPQYIKNRTLTVSCDSSAFAQELKLHEQEILEILNKSIENDEKVERIRYLL